MNKYSSLIKQILIGFLGALITFGLFLIPIPYYVMGPGSAQEIKSSVWVDKHPIKEQGEFLLTTVSVREAILFDLLWSQLSAKMELIKREQMVLQGESKQEYELRQKEDMIQSQNAAIAAAFRQSHQPVRIVYQGVKILSFAKYPVKGLQLGDRILQIDYLPITDDAMMIKYLQRKKVGDLVTLKLERNKQTLTRRVKLISLAAQRIGIGIVPGAQIRVASKPAVRISAGEIGGPSAGLMFSLEVFNRLRSNNLTNGQRIAGTGTIDLEGSVGQIGGIQYKVMSAEKEKAVLFFCPKDIKPTDSNERIAKETVQKLGLQIRVVPVQSLQEAIDYLSRLTASSQLAYIFTSGKTPCCSNRDESEFGQGRMVI